MDRSIGKSIRFVTSHDPMFVPSRLSKELTRGEFVLKGLLIESVWFFRPNFERSDVPANLPCSRFSAFAELREGLFQ